MLLLGFALSCALLVSAQATINDRGQYVPTAEELASSKRLYEALLNPNFIRLRLIFLDPNTDEQTAIPPVYTDRDRVVIALILVHSFNEPIRFSQSRDPFTDVQLELLRNGEKMPLTKRAQQKTERSETDPSRDSLVSEFLPGKEYRLAPIDLRQWYGTLSPGQYQLTVRRRFVSGGAWLDSDPIIFNVNEPSADRN